MRKGKDYTLKKFVDWCNVSKKQRAAARGEWGFVFFFFLWLSELTEKQIFSCSKTALPCGWVVSVREELRYYCRKRVPGEGERRGGEEGGKDDSTETDPKGCISRSNGSKKPSYSLGEDINYGQQARAGLKRPRSGKRRKGEEEVEREKGMWAAQRPLPPFLREK